MLEQGIGKKIYDFVGRFISYPNDHARLIHTLWIIHTHLTDAFYTIPILAILSAEKRSGKTRLLEITKLLAHNPLSMISPSDAALYTSIHYADTRPTLLIDEVDRLFERRDTADITATLDASTRATGTVPRVEMKPTRHMEHFRVFAPILLAGIDNGKLPDTIFDRSICIRLKRRADEKVESYRGRKIDPQGAALAEEAATFGKKGLEVAKHMEPPMPDEITDRNADKFEPLFITARLLDQQNVTGVTGDTAVTAPPGWWETKIRLAALASLKEEQDTEASSKGELLLKDIYSIFEDHPFGDKEAMKTQELLDQLINIDISPWSSFQYHDPLDARGLAKLLRPYGIRPKTIRFDKNTEAKGYYKSDFDDAWKRYLPQTPPRASVTTVTDVPSVTNHRIPLSSVTAVTPVPARQFQPF